MMDWMYPFSDQILSNEPLARYSALRLGGAAEWLYVARESLDELSRVVQVAWGNGMNVHILGGGANVLISDHGLKGLVVVNQLKQITFAEDYHLLASAGVGLGTLAQSNLTAFTPLRHGRKLITKLSRVPPSLSRLSSTRVAGVFESGIVFRGCIYDRA